MSKTMIKISKDYLFLLSRIGPFLLIFIHVIVISALALLGLGIACLSYAGVALLHVFLISIWKRFLLSDVYVDERSNEVVFKNLNGNEETFSRKQIIKLSTYSGITTATISFGDREIKKYFIAVSSESLNYLDDGYQISGDDLYELENTPEKLFMEFLKKKKKLFFIPLVTIPLMMLVGYVFMKRGDRKILDYEFNGVVDSVSYDNTRNDLVVTKPTVYIHGKAYYLFYNNWGLRHDIQPGDSIIKLKNTFTVRLIKKNGKEFSY